MKLLLYVYIFFAIIISISAAPDEKTFNRNSLDFRKKLINAKNSFKSKLLNSNKTEINPFESVFIIKDKNSSGSGFYTSLWGIPAGITSAHVIATMQNPLITDSKGNSYKIKAMLALPEDDIVIFELSNPGILKPLAITYDISLFPANSPICTYGNNQGKGVITKLDGTIQSVENKKIKISAKLIPSNSGGALLCNDKVIGILSYPAQITPDMSNLQGTLFEGKTSYLEKYYGAPKCFGIRITSIDPAKSEILNPMSTAGDIKIIQELKTANDKALDYKIKVMKTILKGKSSENLIKSAWALVHRNQYSSKAIEDFYSRLSIDPSQYVCSNKTLEKQYIEQLSIYRRNACMWYFEELFTSKDPAFLKKFILLVKTLKKHFQTAPKCKSCQGKGYRIVEINNPEYKRDKMKFAFNTTYVKCEHCHGTGKIMVSKYYYVLRNKQDADKMFKPLKIDFLGFTPGSDKSASRSETRKMLFSGRIISDISRTYFYNKNPRFKLKNSVALNYVLDKLQDIRIYFPYSKELYQQMKELLEKKYGKSTWETEDKSTFCEIDKPEYRITIGWVYIISAKFKLKPSLYVSCTHKELSKAKYAFKHLTDKKGNIKDFAQKTKNTKDTGF